MPVDRAESSASRSAVSPSTLTEPAQSVVTLVSTKRLFLLNQKPALSTGRCWRTTAGCSGKAFEFDPGSVIRRQSLRVWFLECFAANPNACAQLRPWSAVTGNGRLAQESGIRATGGSPSMPRTPGSGQTALSRLCKSHYVEHSHVANVG